MVGGYAGKILRIDLLSRIEWIFSQGPYVRDRIMYGSPLTMSFTQLRGILPTKNFQLGQFDLFEEIDRCIVCHQCAKPPCADACVVKAIEIDSKLKIPIVDKPKCIGCMACVKACPFNAIWFDFESMVPIKCDLCGGDPKCVKFCRALPHIWYSAIMYTTPENWVNKRSQRKSKMFRLGNLDDS